jgi:hypothetical protein
LTTKLHLGCEQGQKPLAIVLTAGHRGDSPQLIPVLAAIRVPRLVTGRPRTRPDRVLANKAYTSKANRQYLRRRGNRLRSTPRTSQRLADRGAGGGVPQPHGSAIFSTSRDQRVQRQPGVSATWGPRCDTTGLCGGDHHDGSCTCHWFASPSPSDPGSKFLGLKLALL